MAINGHKYIKRPWDFENFLVFWCTLCITLINIFIIILKDTNIPLLTFEFKTSFPQPLPLFPNPWHFLCTQVPSIFYKISEVCELRSQTLENGRVSEEWNACAFVQYCTVCIGWDQVVLNGVAVLVVIAGTKTHCCVPELLAAFSG